MSYVLIPFMPLNATKCVKAPDGHYYWETNGRSEDMTDRFHHDPEGECSDCGAITDSFNRICHHCGGAVYPC